MRVPLATASQTLWRVVSAQAGRSAAARQQLAPSAWPQLGGWHFRAGSERFAGPWAKRTRLTPALDRRMKELDEKERRLQGK